MKRYNGFFKLALSGVLALVCVSANCDMISAEGENAEIPTKIGTDIGGDVSTKGIYTTMTVSIDGGNGKIWTTAKNELTIFPSTVAVIVELYTSDIYQELYTNMELVARNTIADLNMGETLVAEASTGEVQKYWHGRVRYKVDNNAWKELSTGTVLFSANGTYLGII